MSCMYETDHSIVFGAVQHLLRDVCIYAFTAVTRFVGA